MDLGIPPGLGVLEDFKVTVEVADVDPQLCPQCHHVAVYLVQATIIHRGGVHQPPMAWTCGSDECLAADLDDDPDTAAST